MTRDIDIVIAADAADYERRIRPAFEDAYLVNDPIRVGERYIGGIIHRTEITRADLILGRDDAWARSAMGRRRRVDHPILGPTWIIAPEDLILAKLEWSDGGASELQLRDVRSVVRLNDDLDWDYLRRYAVDLGSPIYWSRSVPADLAQLQLDERSGDAARRPRTPPRGAGAPGTTLAWAAADHAGPLTELERARFLLRRLYPDLEGQRLEAIMDRLEADWRAGTWAGFRRPDPAPPTG
jgi:hypothetical protein